MPQLAGSGEVGVAPSRVLGLVAELFKGGGLKLSRCGVLGLGEDDVTCQRCCPALVAVDQRLSCDLKRPFGAADRLDIAAAGVARSKRIKVDGVAVVDAEVALVDAARVVAHRTVSAARVPERGKALR
ncbi:unannotated protein [freshwater metagenome]|uniref:Unannotated protein n=1 Tax=freshwater metagenome TaxID=449393 RepID=A0A6J7RVD6_9ZZZZ